MAKKKKPSMNGPSPDAEDGAVITKGYKVFDGANLEGADLSGVSFKDAAPRYSFSQLNLKDADLRGADFTGLFLKGINFEGADLRGAIFTETRLDGLCSFRGADLTDAVFRGSSMGGDIDEFPDFRDAILVRADLTETLFGQAIFTGADFTDAILAGARFNDCEISGEQIGAAAERLVGLFVSGKREKKLRLTGLNLAHKKAVGVDFVFVELVNCNFAGANLTGAKFVSTQLIDCDFSGAHLSGALMSAQPEGRQIEMFVNCNFSDAELKFACVYGANADSLLHKPFHVVRFTGADLQGAFFGDSNLRGADFTGANLMGTTFEDCRLPPGLKVGQKSRRVGGLVLGPNAHLERADLSGKDLRDLNLTGAHLENADLSDTDLSYSSLKDAKLEDANLSGAYLFGTALDGADLTRANLTRSRLRSKHYEIERLRAEAARDNANSGPPERLKMGRRISSFGVPTGYRGSVSMETGSANFTDARFNDAVIDNVAFGSQMTKGRLGGAARADFSGATLNNVYFEPSFNATKAIFKGATLRNNKIHADMRNARFDDSTLDQVAFSGANIKGASFANASLIEPFFSAKNFSGVDFSGAELNAPVFLGQGDMADLTETDFTGATFTGSEEAPGVSASPGQQISLPNPSKWSPSLKEIMAPKVDRERAIVKELIEKDGRYMGMRTGLWIHQTNAPQTKYYGELCVSPYEAGEAIFETRGAYGVVFEGTAPLFDVDVWSSRNNFGMLVPGETPKDWDEPFKEGFLDADSAKFVSLNVLKGHEKITVIKKFKEAGIPINIVQGSEKAAKAHRGKRATAQSREKAMAILEERAKNPGDVIRCAHCDAPAKYKDAKGCVFLYVDDSGAVFCEECSQ